MKINMMVYVKQFVLVTASIFVINKQKYLNIPFKSLQYIAYIVLNVTGFPD